MKSVTKIFSSNEQYEDSIVLEEFAKKFDNNIPVNVPNELYSHTIMTIVLESSVNKCLF